MLPTPDSHPDDVSPSPLDDRGMSADAVESPTLTFTLAPSPSLPPSPSPAHVDTAQRVSCTCPCLKEGPRASSATTVSTKPCGGEANHQGSVCDAALCDQGTCPTKEGVSALADRETSPQPQSWTKKIKDSKPCDATAGQTLVEESSREEEIVRTGERKSEADVGEWDEEEVAGMACSGGVHAAATAGVESTAGERVERGIDRLASYSKKCDDPEVGKFIHLLLTEGEDIPGDSGVSLDDKPEWLDTEKIRMAQQFAQKYFFGLMFSEMLSLFILFSAPGSLQPLIFSGNSDTPFKAFKRYLSTVTRVWSWYSEDLWAEGEARRNLRTVRRLHDIYRRRLNALRDAPSEERLGATKLKGPLWTRGSADVVRTDFRHSNTGCPFLDMSHDRPEWINQMEMSYTQMGFVGLAVTYPSRFGIGGASTQELESFVHLWRVIGYLLGVEDRFNFCSEGLESVQKRTKFVMSEIVPANLARVGADWEHMSRCVVAGVNHYIEGITYEVSLMYMLETIGLDAPCVWNSMSVREKRLYRFACFLLEWVMRIPPLRALINWTLRRSIKRAQNRPAEWLRAKEERVYSYQRKGTAGTAGSAQEQNRGSAPESEPTPRLAG